MARTSNQVMSLANHQVDVMQFEDAHSSSIGIHIAGRPPTQPRPRGVTRGGRTIFYNPAARAKHIYCTKIKEELRANGLLPAPAQVPNPGPLFIGPVSVVVTFGVANMNKDLDNMVKFILDVLEVAGIYGNDRFVRRIVAEKVQSATEFTNLSVSAVLPGTNINILAMLSAATI